MIEMWTRRLEVHAQAMLGRELREAEVREKRKAAKLGKPAHPATTVAFTKYRENRIRLAKASGIEYPSRCPHCRGGEIIRAGVAGASQRYRCRGCRRTFGASGKAIAIRWKLMCHRCGSTGARNCGPGNSGGRKGFCASCKLYFTQGGREELDRGGLLLKARIEILGLQSEVAAEITQQARLDVLQGLGYCWTVRLDIQGAWRAVRGEYAQRGSDHPAFRAANGQKWVEWADD